MHLRNMELNDCEERLDFDGLTDGMPKYRGIAPAGASEDSSAWVLYRFTYTTISGIRFMTKRQVKLKSTWTNRTTELP